MVYNTYCNRTLLQWTRFRMDPAASGLRLKPKPRTSENWASKPDIKWNYTKFVIEREDNVVARFEPTADIADAEARVKALL